MNVTAAAASLQPRRANEPTSYSHPVDAAPVAAPPFSNLLPSPDEGTNGKPASGRTDGGTDGGREGCLGASLIVSPHGRGASERRANGAFCAFDEVDGAAPACFRWAGAWAEALM